MDRESPDDWSEEDIFDFAQNLRKASKPIMLGANKIDAPNAKENFERLSELEYTVLPMSCEGELALRRAAEKGLIEYSPGDSEFTIIEKKT